MSYESFKEALEVINHPLLYGDEEKYFALSVLNDIPKSVLVRYYERLDKEGKTYIYMFTFTLKPSLSKAQKTAAHNYIVSTKNRQGTLQIKNMAYVEEHAKTNKHWHLVIESDKPLRADCFKQYHNTYGMVKKSKEHKNLAEKVQMQGAIDYISKEGDIIYLVKDYKIIG